MVFKKISSLYLLVLCTTNTSESHHLAKRNSCDCLKSKPLIKPNHHVESNKELHKIFGQLDNPKDQSIEKKTPEAKILRKGDRPNIPIQYQPHVTSENIYWNPLNYLTSNIGPLKTSHLNPDPNRTEALLKQIWLSRQLGNVNIRQGQNSNFNTKIQQATNPLQLQVIEPEREQQSNQPSLRLIPLDEYYLNKQETIISPPRVTPIPKNDVHKQQTNIPSLRIIPLAEYGANKQEPIILRPRVPHIAKNDIDKQQMNSPSLRVIPRAEYAVDKQQAIIPYLANPQKYVNYDYNVPYKYDSNTYDDLTLDEKRYHIPAAHIAPNRINQEPRKFSKWVLEQTEILHSINQSPDDVDLSGLGFSILQILSENNMHLTNNSMLVDTYGTVSSLNSLNLTPLFIGNTISLRQLLEGKYEVSSSKFQTPYLEAILVSASQPLKILGVIPLGKKYLPLSTPSSLTNIWGSIPKNLNSRNPGEDEVVDEKDPKQDESEKTYDKKTKKSNRDDINESNYNPGQSSHYVNVDENYNSIGRSHLFKILPSRQELRPEDDLTNDLPYSKQLKVINQEQPESNGGRLFIPHIEFQERPINVLTSRHNVPATIVASKIYKPDMVHIPGISSLLDITFRSHNPRSKEKITQNDVVAEVSDGTVMSDVVEKFNDSAKAAAKLNLLKKEIPVSVGEAIVPSSRFQIIGDDAKSTLELNELNLQSILDKANGSNFGQYLSLFEDLGVGSRSGNVIDLPEIPPENVHVGNHAFDLMENYDDDVGDFRIIGGNAATGSGTPLSNKGRSGYVF